MTQDASSITPQNWPRSSLNGFLTFGLWTKSLIWNRQWYEPVKYFIENVKICSPPPKPSQLETKFCSSRVEKSGTRSPEYRNIISLHALRLTVTTCRFWSYFKYNKYEAVQVFVFLKYSVNEEMLNIGRHRNLWALKLMRIQPQWGSQGQDTRFASRALPRAHGTDQIF